MARKKRRKNPFVSAHSVAAGMGYPFLRGDGRSVRGRFWASRFTRGADGRGPALYVYFDAKERPRTFKRKNSVARRRRRCR